MAAEGRHKGFHSAREQSSNAALGPGNELVNAETRGQDAEAMSN